MLLFASVTSFVAVLLYDPINIYLYGDKKPNSSRPFMDLISWTMILISPLKPL